MSDTKLVKKNSIRRFLPLQSMVAGVIVIFLIYAFFSGLSFQFYASALFLFYSFTNKMWISVVCLGIFQTALMVPFRIIRIIKSNNIKEFQSQIGGLKSEREMTSSIKENVSKGNLTFLFYLVDFVVQLVSFMTIGRLFLTDFYSFKIDPARLYSFVPYPDYPIQETFFKIPYPIVTKTVDLGLKAVLISWLVLVIIQVVIFSLKKFYRNAVKSGEAKPISSQISKYASGYLVIAMIISAVVIRNFPLSFELGIFSGDVSIPNPRLNSITAIVTFITILWFGIPKNIRKAKMAEKAGIPTHIIEKTQKLMFKESLKNASILGLGAYLITNQIPSAFELSIFTLEIISLSSPLTLDKIILSATTKKTVIEEEKENKNDEG
ncbi:MAG: hypothetical protein OEX81_03225 [Candidatus Pacebacteria bacterium]|nr:hypothetical protein [Candidatus Paceibacterota bacterium]